MKRDSIGYELYMKYNDPAKVRSKEEMLRKGLNGLVDSAVWKWAAPIIEDAMERKEREKEGIRVVEGGRVSFLQ